MKNTKIIETPLIAQELYRLYGVFLANNPGAEEFNTLLNENNPNIEIDRHAYEPAEVLFAVDYEAYKEMYLEWLTQQ